MFKTLVGDWVDRTPRLRVSRRERERETDKNPGLVEYIETLGFL